MELINLSPFAVLHLLVLDNDGKERLLVIVKATYALTDAGPVLAPEQEAVCMADQYFGEPAASSIRYAAETALFKPAADLVLLGNAYATARSEGWVDVLLQVGRIEKTLRVFGDRHWLGTTGNERISPPRPFEVMPLIFENAFGGFDDSNPEAAEVEERNPVGKGFRAGKSRRTLEGTPLPNLENPRQPIRSAAERPEPVAPGFVAPAWLPRRLCAGTYDSRWQQERAPFLPDDFNHWYHQVAPRDQMLQGYFQGGEALRLENACPDGPIACSLPREEIEVVVRLGEQRSRVAVNLDTVVLDGERKNLTLLWRGSMPVHNQVYRVEWIKVAAGGGL